MKTTDILDQIDTALDDWEVGPDAMRCPGSHDTGATATDHRDRFDQLRAGLGGTLTVELTFDTSGFETAMRRMVEQLDRLNWDALRRFAEAIRQAESPPATSGPPPLCIDGHAYHRRTRNRRKR